MNVSGLKKFLWKCTAINFFILLAMSPLIFMTDVIYEIHGHWFLGSKEELSVFLYQWISYFKILWIFFNVVPYSALYLMDKEAKKNKVT